MYLVGDGRHNIGNGIEWRSVAVNKWPHLFQILCKLDDKIGAMTNTPTDLTLISLHEIQDEVVIIQLQGLNYYEYTKFIPLLHVNASTHDTKHSPMS